MEATDMRLLFCDACLDGLYDAKGWRELLLRYSNRRLDADIVAEFLERDARPFVADSTSEELGFCHLANVQVALAADTFVGAPIDTTAPEAWLALADAVKAASVLAMMPGYRTEGSDTVANSVWFVAYIADTMLRATSPAHRASALCAEMASPTERFVRQRALRTFADIVCGRSTLWLSAIYDLAAEAALAAGRDFDALFDEYADAHLSAMVGIVDMLFSGNALTTYLAYVSNMSVVYDSYQASVFEDAFESGIEASEELAISARGAVNADAYAKVATLLPKSGDVRGLHAFNAISGLTPVANVATLPREVESRLWGELSEGME